MGSLDNIVTTELSFLTIMVDSAPPVNKKLCIIGDGNTGKTALLYRFKNKTFDEKYEPTIFETESHTCEFDNKKVNLSLWDTAGQEEFDRIRVLAYDKTDILLITCCAVSRISYRNVKDLWLKELEKNKSKFTNAAIVLVGTKCDLKGVAEARDNPEDKDVTKAEGEQLARDIGATCYIETSAKTGDGIKELFEEAIRASMVGGKRDPG